MASKKINACRGRGGVSEQEHQGFLGGETIVSSCDTVNYE